MTAFAVAADRDPINRARLSAIAALMAMAAGDRVQAAELLCPHGSSQVPTCSQTSRVCVFDADETGRDDALETLLRGVRDDELAAEPTCLLFLAERAVRRGDLEGALTLYERAWARHLRIVGGRLGKARVLIERMVCGRSALPARDQHQAVELATSVRDDMRLWAGPSENAHRLVVHERMLIGAFNEVIALATPTQFGGQANDRESSDPTVAVLGAQACIALGDRTRAGRFGDAVRGAPTEALIRALAADPDQPKASTVAMWRTAFDKVDNPVAARICLHQLASRGARSTLLTWSEPEHSPTSTTTTGRCSPLETPPPSATSKRRRSKYARPVIRWSTSVRLAAGPIAQTFTRAPTGSARTAGHTTLWPRCVSLRPTPMSGSWRVTSKPASTKSRTRP